jgi:tetratricopeptide (TPR) repeat protein
MKKAAFIFILLIFSNLSIFSQDLRKKAEDNPLDCALYLLRNDQGAISPAQLSLVFLEVGRYDDAFRTIDLEDNEAKLLFLSLFSAKLAHKGNHTESARFLNKLYEVFRQNKDSLDESHLVYLVPSLIKLGKTEEVFSLISLFEDYEKTKAAIEISKDFFRANQTENAVKILETAYITASIAEKAEIIELYARHNQNDKAEKLLAEFALNAIAEEKDVYIRRSILSAVINADLALGKVVQALELRQKYGETADLIGYFKLIDGLVEFNHLDKATFYLSQSVFDTQQPQYYNFEFQNTLIQLADRFIAGGNNDLALKTLNIALQFARKHGESYGLTSIGITQLDIKINLLRRIKEYYFKLGHFDKTQDIINAINSRNGIAREFIVETLTDSAKRQIKVLPRREIDKILAQAQKTGSETIGNSQNRIKLFIAEVYARMNEKNKSVELLTEVLASELLTVNKDVCCYSGDNLIKIGSIFEQNKLESDSKMKKVLREFTKVVSLQ